MKTIIPEVLIKIGLAVLEIIFVGALAYARILNTGWILILMGIGLLAWIVIHLADWPVIVIQ